MYVYMYFGRFVR